jgi:hypothetical protein
MYIHVYIYMYIYRASWGIDMCILNGISQGIYQWLFFVFFLWALQPSSFFVGNIDGIPGGKETFWSG